MATLNSKEQKGMTWLVRRTSTIHVGYVGGFCFREDGYMLTSYHGEAEAQGCSFGVRNFHGDGFRTAEFVFGFPAQDVAILKITPAYDGEKFPYIPLTAESLPLKWGELLVFFGHPDRLPFSLCSGATPFPYLPPPNLSVLFNPINLTVATTDVSEISAVWTIDPPITARSVAADAVNNDGKLKYLSKLHPNLPLIVQKCQSESPGCPVFRKEENGRFVGMTLFRIDGYCYHLGVDVLSYLVGIWEKEHLGQIGASSSSNV